MLPDGRVLLVGDAAALINPASGEGIFDAFLSGLIAGEVASLGHEAGAEYRGRLHLALRRHQRHADGTSASHDARLGDLQAQRSARRVLRFVEQFTGPLGDAEPGHRDTVVREVVAGTLLGPDSSAVSIGEASLELPQFGLLADGPRVANALTGRRSP